MSKITTLTATEYYQRKKLKREGLLFEISKIDKEIGVATMIRSKRTFV